MDFTLRRRLERRQALDALRQAGDGRACARAGTGIALRTSRHPRRRLHPVLHVAQHRRDGIVRLQRLAELHRPRRLGRAVGETALDGRAERAMDLFGEARPKKDGERLDLDFRLEAAAVGAVVVEDEVVVVVNGNRAPVDEIAFPAAARQLDRKALAERRVFHVPVGAADDGILPAPMAVEPLAIGLVGAPASAAPSPASAAR